MPDISHYSLIGNCRAAALVSKTGSIDWCCLPEFHSPAIFASILDKEKGGSFSITPLTDFKSSQKYLPDTNVLETSFVSAEGHARLLDAFTLIRKEKSSHYLYAEHEILRILEGIEGEVRIRLVYSPRPFYGKYYPRMEDRRKMGVHFYWKENIYTLLSTLETPYKIVLDNETHIAFAEFSIQAGERIIFSLSYSSNNPAILPELKVTGYQRMQDTIEYWRSWINHCQYSGYFQDHVRRSALVLKLLAHAPSGSIIAAPTTSLPEEIGGERNWDYRYCWLRDASFTVNVLLELGFEEEAHAYMNWILHATRLTRPELQVVYSVYGHTSLTEENLNWLEGYKNSRPVRIGNGADRQFQLDLYGEVLDAIYRYSEIIPSFDKETKKFVLDLGKAIFSLWDKPDNGIWEIRSSPVYHTHSQAMAWVGLDRFIRLCKKYHWKVDALPKYEKLLSQIRNQIEQFGFNSKLNSYTREFNGDSVDASLLTLALTGYCEAHTPRMVSTRELISGRLSKNNFVYRYLGDNDGLSGGEGSFGVCTFWLAENYAKEGNLNRATEIFESMIQCASPTGLFSEEIAPETGALLGNYPQSFTHIGLINTAISINKLLKKGEKE